MDSNTLFAALKLSCEGPGKVLFAQGPQHPLPLVLELLLGHGDACLLPFLA